MLKQVGLEHSLKHLIGDNWPLFLLCLIHGVIFLVIFQNGTYGPNFRDYYRVEYEYASNIFHGQLPYRDFPVEYPPIAILFFLLPRVFTATSGAYVWAFTVEMLVFDLVGIFFIAALSNRLGLNRWKTLIAYTVILLAIGPIITVRYDLIPAIITLLALYFMMKGRSKAAWIFLAIGTFTKLYPAILAPLFLIYQLHRQQKRQAVEGIISFVIASAIVVVPALIISADGFWQSFTYHTQRGLQIGSSYASILELGYAFNLIHPEFIYNFGSWNLLSPLADILAEASFAVMLVCLIVGYWFFYKGLQNLPRTKADHEVWRDSSGLLINYSIVIILAFMLTSKVFSPQYIIWVLPLVPLAVGRWKTACTLMFVMVGLMSFFIFPEYYESIRTGYVPVIVMLVLRNVAMIIMAFLLANSGLRQVGKNSNSVVSVK